MGFISPIGPPYISIHLHLQKLAQLDEEKQQHLFDVCCVWVYLAPKMAQTYPKSVVDKYHALFMKGMLGSYQIHVGKII